MASGEHPVYGYMGFVKGVLRLQTSGAILKKEYERRCAKSAQTGAKATLTDAIWDGYWSTTLELERKVALTREHGQILLCWHGTKAIESEVQA